MSEQTVAHKHTGELLQANTVINSNVNVIYPPIAAPNFINENYLHIMAPSAFLPGHNPMNIMYAPGSAPNLLPVMMAPPQFLQAPNPNLGFFPPSRPPVRCEVCNVTLSDELNLIQHKLGKKHALAMGILDDESSNADRLEAIVNAMGSSKPYIHMVEPSRSGVCQFVCDVCPDVCIFESDIILHINGRKHKEGLEEHLALEERLEVKSNKTNFEKLKASLDERESMVTIREKKVAARETECDRRDEALSKREAELQLKEVKFLPLSEQQYYSKLIAQKEEVEVEYKKLMKTKFLTDEEEEARSKLKVALDDIKKTITNLLENKSNNVPKDISANETRMFQNPKENRNVSKEELKKQMEEKLLHAMKGGTLGKLAKVISQNPAMKAVLEKLERDHNIGNTSQNIGKHQDALQEDRNLGLLPSREEIMAEQRRQDEDLHREFLVQERALLDRQTFNTSSHGGFRPNTQYFDEPLSKQYRRSAPFPQHEGLRPPISHHIPPMPVTPVPGHGLRPHPSQVGFVPSNRRKRPLLGVTPPQGYPPNN